MTSTPTRLFALALLLVSTTVVQAQDLAPELQFGARGVVSGNVNIASGQTTSAVSDFSDTALLMGARQKLFHNARGQLVIGFQFPDAESNLGQVFFHRVFVRLENQRNAFQIGRTRLSSTLVEFPTLRDDDALLFTDVVSPFSDGEDSEDSQFGNVFYRLGANFDVGVQVQQTWNSGDLERLFEHRSTGFKLALIYSVDQRFNNQFDDRDSILNLEHGYVK